MAVYYKFKSAKEFDTVAIDGHYISVGTLKEKIFELKHLGRGTDFDLVVTNAQTDEEYLDEGMLIPKNTSVIIRRIPGKPRKPIVTAPVTEIAESMVENNSGDVQALNGSFAGVEPSSMQYGDDADWDGFGNDLYAIPETVSVRSSIPVQDAAPAVKENEDEDSMIRALVETPALDWQRQPESFGSGRGFQRGGGRMMGGRGFGGRGGPYESKTPPPGYVCHRCKVPGHFIQHCPTNGDPNYDIRRVKPPTGIPKSMLFATPDGSYALPSGAVAVLKPNEAAFEKEIEGMPSTRSVGDLPPELHCPLCEGVIKDAVLTSKCCFTSYCDKCIRDHIISKSMCVCGATNVLADDLLPNKTLRDTINRILESNDSSAERGGSAFQVQDMESRIPQVKAQSPAQSAASKGQQGSAQPLQKEETSEIAEGVEENKVTVSEALGKQENMRTPQVPDVLEATNDLKSFKEAQSQGSGQLADEEVHQKPASGEEGKKKKKKKVRVPPNAADMQWRGGQEPEPGNYMMPPGPMGPAAFDPFWNGGMAPGPMDCFPYPPGPMPYMNMNMNMNGYIPGPMDVPFPGVMPHDPFMGNMFSYGPPPHRDLSELSMGFNPRPPMSREEFEAHKADVKRRREMERRGERNMPRDQDYGRDPNSRREVSKDRNYARDSKDSRDYGREESSRVDNGPLKSKSKSTSHPSGSHRSSRASPDGRSRDPSSKRDLRHHLHHDDHHRTTRERERSESPTDKKLKGSVFSRISFGPGSKDAAPKKRKSSENVSDSRPASNGYHEEQKSKKSSAVSVEQDSSDDERHFKRRRPSKYSSLPADVAEEDSHHSRGRDYGRKRR